MGTLTLDGSTREFLCINKKAGRAKGTDTSRWIYLWMGAYRVSLLIAYIFSIKLGK